MNERFKLVRKALNLNQSDFGFSVGVTSAAISRIEKGDRGLTDQMVLAICNKFNVNEEWIRTGKGEMFEEIKNDLDSLAKEMNLSALEMELVKGYICMPKDMRQYIVNNLERIIGRVPWENEITATTDNDQGTLKVISNNSDKWEKEREGVNEMLEKKEAVKMQEELDKSANASLKERSYC